MARRNEEMNNRMRTMEDLLITVGDALRRQMQHENRQPDALELIARYKPPHYKGQEEPAILEDWIRAFDKIFSATDFTEAQKVTAATYHLESVADVWWQNHSQMQVHLPTYTWEEFKEDLRSRFYPASIKQAKYEEFIRLRQGLMTVQEYYARYIELERFAPLYATNEEDRARKFEMGLNPIIRTAFGGKNFSTLQKVYDRALNLSRLQLSQKERAPSSEPSEADRPNKRPKFNKHKQFQKPQGQGNRDNGTFKSPRTNHPPCPKCNQWHNSQECRIECYRCGQPGHMSWNCFKPYNQLDEKRGNISYNQDGRPPRTTPAQEQGRGNRLNVISQAEADHQQM